MHIHSNTLRCTSSNDTRQLLTAIFLRVKTFNLINFFFFQTNGHRRRITWQQRNTYRSYYDLQDNSDNAILSRSFKWNLTCEFSSRSHVLMSLKLFIKPLLKGHYINRNTCKLKTAERKLCVNSRRGDSPLTQHSSFSRFG